MFLHNPKSIHTLPKSIHTLPKSIHTLPKSIHTLFLYANHSLGYKQSERFTKRFIKILTKTVHLAMDIFSFFI